MPSSKTLPQVFIIIPQADINFPFLPNSIFWRYFFLSRKRGGGGERDGEGGEDEVFEKITKINKGIGVLVTIFDKFYRLCNLYSFALSFLVQ